MLVYIAEGNFLFFCDTFAQLMNVYCGYYAELAYVRSDVTHSYTIL